MIQTQPDPRKAIDTIQAIADRLGPAHAAYWVGSNMILTLSQARGYADIVLWQDDTAKAIEWRDEMRAGLTVVTQTQDLVYGHAMHNRPKDESHSATIDIIVRNGLMNSLSATDLIGDTDTSDYLRNLTADVFIPWIADAIAAQQDSRHYSHEQCLMAAEGIVLGYPDAAIRSFVEAPPEMPVTDMRSVDIPLSYSYVCPLPRYYYQPQHAGDPTLQTHKKRWSELLDGFYASDLHRTLAKDRAFTAKVTELGLQNGM